MPVATPAPRRPRMAMLVGNQVVGDSRVEKAAVSAVRAGYDVVVVGVSHRTTFNLGRYGSVPILRVPVTFRRHLDWQTLHGTARPDATDWSAVLDPEEAAAIVLENDETGAQTEAHQVRMMQEVAKLTAGSNGALDPADAERTVETLLSGGSDPVISKKPEGAWTSAITDKALK